jgi:hypothetical protein
MADAPVRLASAIIIIIMPNRQKPLICERLHILAGAPVVVSPFHKAGTNHDLPLR